MATTIAAKTTTAKEIEATLLGKRDERQSQACLRFFKTGKGQYGEGDQFLGIRNPQVRGVVREVWQATTLAEAARLVRNPWHEVRLGGLLIMAKQMEQAVRQRNEGEMQAIVEQYLSLHAHVNNWDLVDLSAPSVMGYWEALHPEDKRMDDWMVASCSTLWQRRIAMVSTWRLVRVGRYRELTRRARALLTSKEDLLHKAAGWMLRELGKNGGMAELRAFLGAHAAAMPSTMLRYAIEKLPEPERQRWLQARRRKARNF